MAHPRPFFPWFFHPLRTHLPLSQLHVALPFHRYVSLGIDFKRFTLFPTIVVKNWTLIANNLLRYASIHDTVAGGLTELVCVCVCVCVWLQKGEDEPVTIAEVLHFSRELNPEQEELILKVIGLVVIKYLLPFFTGQASSAWSHSYSSWCNPRYCRHPYNTPSCWHWKYYCYCLFSLQIFAF